MLPVISQGIASPAPKANIKMVTYVLIAIILYAHNVPDPLLHVIFSALIFVINVTPQEIVLIVQKGIIGM